MENPNFKLHVNAPSLQYCYLHDQNLKNYLLDNATNVVEANIGDLFERGEQDENDNYGHSIYQLLRALPNVATLTLRNKVLSFILTNYF
jgi:hypothetical protein